MGGGAGVDSAAHATCCPWLQHIRARLPGTLQAGCPITNDCSNVAGMAGHPMLVRACGLLARARPACSPWTPTPEGLRQVRALYKVRRPAQGLPAWSRMHAAAAAWPSAAHATTASPPCYPQRTPAGLFPPIPPLQLNLCMAPPGLSTARFGSPPVQQPAG